MGDRRKAIAAAHARVAAAKPEPPKRALQKQIGGQHYKRLKIQPVEYAFANNLPFCEATAIKHLTRWREKNGIEDLRKAIHYIELLIEMEEKRLDAEVAGMGEL